MLAVREAQAHQPGDQDQVVAALQTQVDAIMAASNRPMFCLQAMSMTLRKADKTICEFLTGQRRYKGSISTTGVIEILFSQMLTDSPSKRTKSIAEVAMVSWVDLAITGLPPSRSGQNRIRP